MTELSEQLQQIADALERLSPKQREEPDWLAHRAYAWGSDGARGVERIAAQDLGLLRGIDRQKKSVAENIAHHACGIAAHDMLLWGARGMGKSALVRSAVAAAQEENAGRIALVQIGTDALKSLGALFGALAQVDRQFVVYIDDLGFAPGDDIGPRHLRSWLDGGVEARPANVRIAVTSNRRAIVSRDASEQDNPLNPRDAVDDQLALADRFGLSIGFHACSQDDYLAIIEGYAKHFQLEWNEAAALEWTKRRGSRSGRTAWHYINELAAKLGKAV